MKRMLTSVCAGFVLLFGGFCSLSWTLTPQTAAGDSAATQAAAATASSAGTVVPRLVQFKGVVTDSSGKAATGTVAITFSLYALQDGGAPLWSETQTLALDSEGHYVVFLGAASPDGLPLDLFATGSARWLGVAPALPGVGEQTRVLLVGVPYALKAADADTLGGKPASAFMTNDSLAAGTTGPTSAPGNASANAGAAAGATATAKSETKKPASNVTGSGTTNYVPLWTSSSNLGNSALFQTGSGSTAMVGIGTTSPTNALQVNGPTPIYSTGSGAGLAFQDRTGGTSPYAEWYSTGDVARFWWSDKGDIVGITTAGNVGIGTTSPTNTLQVNGATPIYSTGSGAGLAFQDRSGGTSPYGEWYSTGDVARFWWSDKGDVLGITTTGSVGIGTEAPAATLEVNGTAKFDQSVTFASGQAFPGTASLGANSFVGNQSITGNLVVSSSGTISVQTTGGGFTIEPNSNSPNVIGGYVGNTVTSGAFGATIAGGGIGIGLNSVTATEGTIGGGASNTAGNQATVGGGSTNVASGQESTVGGGAFNTASGLQSTVSAGQSNTASATGATVGGGIANSASATGATVPGGQSNQAQGFDSFAAGTSAQAAANGTFVWGDDSAGTISSTAADQFIVRASGGLWLGTNNSVVIPLGAFIATSTGALLTTGGTWTNASDRNLKENFTAVNQGSVLKRIAALPMFTWNYKAQPSSVRHLGPMAQDFHAAFGLGEDDKHISTVDAEGVALAAIQELYKLNVQKDARIRQLAGEIRNSNREKDAKLAQQAAQIRLLTAKMEKLEAVQQQVNALAARLSRMENATAPVVQAKTGRPAGSAGGGGR